MPCSCADFGGAADRQFTAIKVAKELKAYRGGRIGPTTRRLRDGLAEAGLTHGTLLDIGGGVGALTFELLDCGVKSATVLEASSAYAAAAQDEAIRRTRGPAVNVVHGDLLELSEKLPSADVGSRLIFGSHWKSHSPGGRWCSTKRFSRTACSSMTR